MAEQLAPNLWRLEIPLVGNPLKTLNSYLLCGGDRSLLIDTGFRQDPCREAMNAQLEEIGADRDRMDLFLTHLHSDHTGLAPELIRPGRRIYISRDDGTGMREGLRGDYWERVYQSYVREGFPQEEIEQLRDRNPAQGAGPRSRQGPFVYLEDGDPLNYGGCLLRCILTPGHTPGHLCLFAPEQGWLFSGDHVLFDITPNICRWERMEDALGSYLKSLEKIQTLPVSLVLPAHRSNRGRLAERAETLKAHHAQRLNEVLALVAREPGLTAYETAGRMTWSIRCRDWADFPVSQKFFAVGEAMAHLDHLMVRGQLCRRERGGTFRYYRSGD